MFNRYLVYVLFFLSSIAAGATLTVGPGGQFTKPCQAFAAATAGDTILIDATGDYKGDVCAIAPSNLLIRGVNGRARIDAAGTGALGKAAWVVQGNNTIIENVEILNCKVPDRNGAAVRLEGDGLTLRWVYFHHNENGLLSGGTGDILIEFSEFSYSAISDSAGIAHNVYVGRQRSLTVRFSYIHHSHIGHGVKSRADVTKLYYNRIMTENSGTGSLEIDIPNGGRATVVGNLVQQGPLSENSAMISFGTEGASAVNEMRMAHNTFVSERAGRIFLVPSSIATTGSTSGLVVNNIFQGAVVLAPSYFSDRVAFQNNLAGDGWLSDMHNFNYQLLPGSPAINTAVTSPADLIPVWHYAHPACGTRRTAEGIPDRGAFESNAVQVVVPERCSLSWHDLVARVDFPSVGFMISTPVQVRVALDGLAPAGGAMVKLTSSRPDLAVIPASATIPEGESSITVPMDVTVGTEPVQVVFTATLAGRTTTSNLELSPSLIGVASLYLSSSSVVPSASVTSRVRLNTPAPIGGASVTLTSSHPAAVSVPSTVTIPANSVTSASFNISTVPVAETTMVTITASTGGSSKASGYLTLMAAALSEFSPAQFSVVGGLSTTYKVNLTSIAASGGAVIAMTSSNPAVAAVPASVTVAAGGASASFSVTTSTVAAPTVVTISATYAGVVKTSTLTVMPTRIESLSVSPLVVVGGKPIAAASVTLNGPAPAGGAVVLLTGTNAAAVPPVSVTIPAGAKTSASFMVTTAAVTAPVAVTIGASYGGQTKSVTVTVNPPTLFQLTIPASPISGGKTIVGATVSLDGPAPPGGAVVALTSANPTVVTPPATVTIAAGGTISAAFRVTTGFVTVPTPVIVTATYGGVPKTVTVNVKPTALYSFPLSTSSISGGAAIGSGWVTLDGPAPSGGAVVMLTSANPAVATPPATVTVAAGATQSAPFSVPTNFVSAPTAVVITAAYGGVSKAVTLNVKPTSIYSMSLSTAPVSGGNPIGYSSVILDGPAPPSGAVVTLTSSNPSVAMPPATVAVPGGTTKSALFSVATFSVDVLTTVGITATYGGSSKTVIASVKPTGLYSLNVYAAVVVGGKPLSATVTMDGPAPPAGAVVTLTSANPAAALTPASVFIAAGARVSPAFTIATSSVSLSTAVVITASYRGVSRTGTVNMKPAALQAFTASPLTIKGGLTISSATVMLDGPAPAGGAVVTLSSSNAAAQPPARVTVPAGQSVVSIAIPTQVVSVVTPATVTATLGSVSKAVTLTITP